MTGSAEARRNSAHKPPRTHQRVGFDILGKRRTTLLVDDLFENPTLKSAPLLFSASLHFSKLLPREFAIVDQEKAGVKVSTTLASWQKALNALEKVSRGAGNAELLSKTADEWKRMGDTLDSIWFKTRNDACQHLAAGAYENAFKAHFEAASMFLPAGKQRSVPEAECTLSELKAAACACELWAESARKAGDTKEGRKNAFASKASVYEMERAIYEGLGEGALAKESESNRKNSQLSAQTAGGAASG